eukprot:5262603-Pleurochrysis_carterae.AAC.8
MHKRYSKAQKNGNKKWKQPFTKIATAVTRTRKVDALQGMNALEGLCPSLTPLVAEHRELPGVGDLEALQRGVTFERFSKHFAALVANVMSAPRHLQSSSVSIHKRLGTPHSSVMPVDLQRMIQNSLWGFYNIACILRDASLTGRVNAANGCAVLQGLRYYLAGLEKHDGQHMGQRSPVQSTQHAQSSAPARAIVRRKFHWLCQSSGGAGQGQPIRRLQEFPSH